MEWTVRWGSGTKGQVWPMAATMTESRQSTVRVSEPDDSSA